MTRRAPLLALVPLGLLGLGAGYVPWEDLTEEDWLFAVATRFAVVDGRKVHYPTPTAELAAALEARTETAALRHLADARLALGDRAGAVAALEKWAEAEGPAAWAEAARWGAAHSEWTLAFSAAQKARPGLEDDARGALVDDEIAWAEAHPDRADPLALRKTRAELFPRDAAAVEDWVRALEREGRLDEAEAALAAAVVFPAERRLLLRSGLLADHGDHRRALELLDAALDEPPGFGPDVRQAFAARTDKAAPRAPEAWRGALDKAFDAPSLVRLATYFQGQGRGDAAALLLQQMERRYEKGLDRRGWLLLARLHGEIDAVPEAFRATLAAAQAGRAEPANDLAALARLALRAGGRPLAWGTYNDAPYRFFARIDRTPGFWTGGLSFLLTGQDWKDALEQLESESLPDRTFVAARALVDELARRAPAHAELPRLRAAVMARHVERGEGREALALLPALQAASPDVAQEARRTALLAMRQVDAPLAEEARLYRERLRALAPDGSRPEKSARERAGSRAGSRRVPAPPVERYHDVLEEALARLEQRDRSHRAALELILREMDRLPEAEALWSELATRLEGWSLDDDLGPRYEKALERFRGEDWWSRLARWYARRARHRDLERLAGDLAARFRGAAVFERSAGAPEVVLEIPAQPPVGGRVRLVPWADWVRWKALERFPHSPVVFKEALEHLRTLESPDRDRSAEVTQVEGRKQNVHHVLVPGALVEERRAALLFVDPERREEYLAVAVRKGDLEKRLAEMEASPERTPVGDQLLFEGWSRLSRFERAAPAAERLAAAYPGDGPLARRVLSLLRSLAALHPAQAAPARALVERTAPALEDPNPLWTELGELEEERGRPEAALEAWRKLLEREPRSAARVEELATLLWDYGHMPDALAVVEDARKRLGRPRLLAFEAGVLREEVRDVEPAIGEYLNAALPDGEECFCSWFERDQRALRRLSQLLGRGRVLRLVEARIDRLAPGLRADEETLVALLPLARITMPEEGVGATADDWISALDQPVDPVGRDARAAAREQWRPEARQGIARVGGALLDKALAMIPAATDVRFLDALEPWSEPLLDARSAKDREVAFKSAVMARRAALLPTEEDRVTAEAARARYLLENGRREDADAVFSALAGRIGSLREGVVRMRAEADRAAYFERARGVDAAAPEWARLSGRYPWSLGLLEDRLAFLARNGRGAEGRKLLEAVVPRAAPGHREPLLERLTREALEAGDLPQARRAVERLLAEPTLDDAHRLGAIHLFARLSFRQDMAFDAAALIAAEGPRLGPERQADLYAELARAAALEKAWKPAVALWTETLNRRPERFWIREACRAAEKAGEVERFRRFFEAQQARSPRDVRWAVVVREIRLAFRDLEGAIEMSKAAVRVRPDRERLWHETADLLVRAERVREAADFLEGWAGPRPADENAARVRSELFARSGDPEKALAVERAALEAYDKQASPGEERDRELGARRARAVRRLLEYGLPRQAWALLVPRKDVGGMATSDLGASGEAEVALASGNFLRLLRARAEDGDFREAAAERLAERGTSESRDEVQAFLLRQLWPETAVKPAEAALRRWWPFATAAGMDRPLRFALARRWVAGTPGPWQLEAPAAFVEAVGQELVGTAARGPVFRTPRTDALWARDLVRRDRGDVLVAFLGPRWTALLTEVRALTPLPKNPARVEWAAWLDDRSALDAFARGVSASPERVAEIAAVLSDRRLWDRFWSLAARGWDRVPLVGLVPEEARTAWFRQWQVPSALDNDPLLRRRGETVERVSVALAHLIAGRPGAADDPLVMKLRGPRTIGDVVGADPRWAWSEFTPRRGAAGAATEAGDDRIVGQRADAGRFPGALWGERPGVAWYALETLVRYRQRDPLAPLVPLEVPGRGQEAARASLAIHLAEALRDPALADEIDALEPAAVGDFTRLRSRLVRLAQTGRTQEAANAFREAVRRQQPSLGEPGFRGLSRIAEDLSLGDVLDFLDAEAPVTPVLLAYLCDRRGPAIATRLRPRDPVEFRAALARRYRAREASLSADEVRYQLSELWASGAAELPSRSLKKLGGLWPHAAEWLARLRVADREAGLAAIGAWPETARLEALLDRDPEPRGDTVRLLRVRVHLARQRDEAATALVDDMLSEADDAPLRLGTMTEASPPASDEEGEEALAALVPPEPATPFAARLQAWLETFRQAGRTEIVAARFRDVVRARREAGAVSPATWRLSLELTADPSERASLLEDLEQAFRRGDWRPEDLGPLVEMLARAAPEVAGRWLARWPATFGYEAVARRAKVLAILKDAPGAARVLVDGRGRGLWSVAEEMKAFDAWRAIAPSPTEPKAAMKGSVEEANAPAAWTSARVFWRKKPLQIGADFAAHLRAHPYDLPAARAALRTAGPGDAEAMRLAAAVLQDPVMEALGEPYGDAVLLRLRTARGLLSTSWRAAGRALDSIDASSLASDLQRRRMPAGEIQAALADVGRIAARQGDDRTVEAALVALEDRKPEDARRLRAELRAFLRPQAPLPFRRTGNEMTPWRPRDLDMSLVAQLLAAEESR
jgi:tetratricopeptide (TPR) repeat protein